MGFFRKLEDDIKELGRDIDDNILQPIKENPVGAIVSVGGMALGIPPVYAGALGGAAGAAAGGGDILEGALLGGVTGYVGGAAGNAAAQAGASSALAGAAGGAAAGAAGAALTGNDIIKGALYGGLAGGASGYVAGKVNNQDGTFTRTNDDGSVIRYNSNGDILQVSPATDDGLAPVYDWDPSTQQMRLTSGNGTQALNILDADQTAELMRNIDPRLINSLADDGVFRVEIEGLPASAENPSYANVEARTPGTELATFEQIDAGQAQWNAAANAWEVRPTGTPAVPIDDLTGLVGPGTPGYDAPDIPFTPPVYDGPEVYTFDDGSTLTIGRDGRATSTDIFGNVYTPGSGTAYASEGGGTTYRFDDGSWMTINPDGSSVVADSNGTVTTHASGTYRGAGTGGATTDLGEIEITAPRLPTGDATPVDEIVITAPRLPGATITTPGATTTTPPGTIDYNPVNTPAPVTPVFPILPQPGQGGDGSTPPGSTGPGGPIQNINLPPGLNPGWIAPTPFYNTTSPAQSQFYWGAHPFQPGPTFNAQLYNQSVGAPMTPWGQQNIAQPLTPQEMTQAYQGQPIVRPPLPVATRYEAPLAQVLPTQPLVATAAQQPYTTEVVGGPVVPA